MKSNELEEDEMRISDEGGKDVMRIMVQVRRERENNHYEDDVSPAASAQKSSTR